MSETFTQEVVFGPWLYGTLLESLTLKVRRSILLSTAGSLVAPIFDIRFGTATDAVTGFVTFALHPGSRRVWLNSLTGSDANDGLTPATAKATVAGAIAVFLGVGFAPSDQLMVAQGGVYSELTGNSNLSGKGGVSKTYPTAILSYDPLDALNTAKYGRAVGAAMPVISFPSLTTGAGQCLFSVAGDDGTTHNIAVQGVELKYAGNDGNSCSAIYVGRHDGIFYQNCRFNGINRAHPNNASPFGFTQAMHFSKCSAWNQWTTDGNTESFYTDNVDGLYFQDCVFAHGGWKIGANRDDATTVGGVSALGHNYYYHATNLNGRIDRIVSIDSATDGHNVRGNATVTYPISLDNPIAANITGISSTFAEAPTGSIVTLTDGLFMGGDNINTASQRGYGIHFGNAAITGCSVDNLLMIDNPELGGVNNYTMQADASNTGVPTANVVLNRVTAYGYASTLQIITGTQAITLTWTNALTDTLAPGAGNALSSAIVFPQAKTRDQVITALLTACNIVPGSSYLARKKQIVDLMLYRPDLDWARYFVTIAYAAFNKTQTLPGISPPDLSAITPNSIYPAGFSPTSLGAAIGIEADPTKLFTDAGTTLVSADGQAVQQANDKSGNARNVSQATSTKRPLYKTTTGKPSLLFDGVDDVLASGSFTPADANGQHWVALSLTFPTNTGTQVPISIDDGSGSLILSRSDNNTGAVEASSWNSAQSPTASPTSTYTANTAVVLIYTVTTTAIEMFVNNVSGGTTTLTGTRATGSVKAFLAAYVGVSNFANMHLYAMWEGPGLLSSTDRGNLNTYLAGLHP